MILTLGTLCDSASEYNEKLCLLGSFNIVHADQFPYNIFRCSYVFQIKWDIETEPGEHKVRVEFSNEQGQQTLNTVQSDITVPIDSNIRSYYSNHMINLQNLSFTKEGVFIARISADDKLLGTIDLQILSHERKIESSEFN